MRKITFHFDVVKVQALDLSCQNFSQCQSFDKDNLYDSEVGFVRKKSSYIRTHTQTSNMIGAPPFILSSAHYCLVTLPLSKSLIKEKNFRKSSMDTKECLFIINSFCSQWWLIKKKKCAGFNLFFFVWYFILEAKSLFNHLSKNISHYLRIYAFGYNF